MSRRSESRPNKSLPRQKRWNLADAKARLSELVERAARGEEIVIALRGIPRARLLPLDTSAKRALRVPGKGKGRFRIGPDFNDALPSDVLGSFLGSRPRRKAGS